MSGGGGGVLINIGNKIMLLIHGNAPCVQIYGLMTNEKLLKLPCSSLNTGKLTGLTVTDDIILLVLICDKYCILCFISHQCQVEVPAVL